MYLAIGRRISYTPSVEAQLVEKHAKCCLSVWSYFADVMLTYERYQALCAINICVPGEPGNEANALLFVPAVLYHLYSTSMNRWL